MIFKQWQQVLDGTKTQTRRLVQKGELLKVNDPPYNSWPFPATVLKDWRLKWMVSKTYAVQPGRGKPAVWWRPDGTVTPTPLDEYVQKTGSVGVTWGPRIKHWLRKRGYTEARIRISGIWREWLQAINQEDIFAEGIGIVVDGKLYPITVSDVATEQFVRLWDSINKKPGTRWADNPEVWPLTFEVKEVSS